MLLYNHMGPLSPNSQEDDQFQTYENCFHFSKTVSKRCITPWNRHRKETSDPRLHSRFPLNTLGCLASENLAARGSAPSPSDTKTFQCLTREWDYMKTDLPKLTLGTTSHTRNRMRMALATLELAPPNVDFGHPHSKVRGLRKVIQPYYHTACILD